MYRTSTEQYHGRLTRGFRLSLTALALAAMAACSQASGPSPEAPPSEVPASPTASQLPIANEDAGPQLLAPEGAPNESYYAPFPVSIQLDGDLSDWEGVPTVTIPPGAEELDGTTYVSFAAAADESTLYLSGYVHDDSIISGQHGVNYWNEDSIEFYINGTNDLDLRTYADGVVQITVPPLNAGAAPEDIILSGVNNANVPADVVVVLTDDGYIVELSVPLQSPVWNIPLQHGRVAGFQVHLNGATTADRNLKVIWSAKDASDSSYYNPSVFGELVFFEIGKQDVARVEPERTPVPTGIPVDPDAAYKNPDLPVADRVEDLLARMTLAEKIGQMTLIEKNSIVVDDITNRGIGGLLSGGGGYPASNTPQGWADMVDGFQEMALQSRLEIPLIYGVDAVHGHGNLRAATLFPHNIGLGAANNPELMEQIGRITAIEMAATGIYWNYAPAVSVPQDIRWGRTYEGYSENTDIVTALSSAYLRGMQADDLSAVDTVVGTPKHYIGDGGTAWGSSTTGGWRIDQGVTEVSEEELRAVHLPPYLEAIDNGARTIMISFSSWGGMKMHAQQYLITDVLKGELGFDGFIVSDWKGIDQITPDYYESVVLAINAGIDMNMVPHNAPRFIDTLTDAVVAGDVPVERIDDAVRRILTVKFEMGLFERPFSDPTLIAKIGSAEHRAVARQAVAESLVLLKNNGGLLPLSKDLPRVFIGGNAVDDIGMQAGGWTIEWQGRRGNITEGTTFLEAVQSTVGTDTEIIFEKSGRFGETSPTGDDICLAVVGERPYAEGWGDSRNLLLPVSASRALRQMEASCENLVVILISGRPVIITDFIDRWDALVAAWLPGTEGAGITDVLFGDLPFNGRLPFTWPASIEQLEDPDAGPPLFPFGFGMDQ